MFLMQNKKVYICMNYLLLFIAFANYSYFRVWEWESWVVLCEDGKAVMPPYCFSRFNVCEKLKPTQSSYGQEGCSRLPRIGRAVAKNMRFEVLFDFVSTSYKLGTLGKLLTFPKPYFPHLLNVNSKGFKSALVYGLSWRWHEWVPISAWIVSQFSDYTDVLGQNFPKYGILVLLEALKFKIVPLFR